MLFEQKLNTCILFKNDRNDRSYFNGRIDVECLHCSKRSGFWVNGWRTVSQSGMNYINLALKPKGDSAPEGEPDRRSN